MKGHAYVPLILAALASIFGIAFLIRPDPPKVLLARYSTSLLGRTGAQRHNALLAVEKLNGRTVPPGTVFSFNKTVGSWSRDQGYRRAPVSYNGTLIADWGGGVCQTSTTLYNSALLAGMSIVERNSHRFAPDYVPPGRDAAVAYDDIDLRIKNPLSSPVRIEASVVGDTLSIAFYGDKSLPIKPEIITQMREVQEPRIYRLPGDGGAHFIKNSGKAGCEVWTYRVTGDVKELISTDSYPVMNKIEESN